MNTPRVERAAENSLINALLAGMLALAAFAIYEMPSHFGKPLSETPEVRVAVVAREMLLSGDYIVPTLGGVDRLKKPPLPYWLTAYSSKLLFPNAETDVRRLARSAQFPPALSAALAVFIVALFGSIFFGRTAGLAAGMILASSEMVMRFGQLGYCDSTLMLFCAASACGFSRLLSKDGGIFSMLFTGVALGLGILTKGHIPLVLLAVPLVAEIFLRRKILSAKQYVLVGLALMVALAVAAPWFVVIEQKRPGAWKEMTSEAGDAVRKVEAPTGATASERNVAGHRQSDNWLYYFYKLPTGVLPWAPLILVGAFSFLSASRKEKPQPTLRDSHLRFMLIYFAAGFLIFLLSEKKQDYYLLPLLPALALGAGAYVSRFNSPGGFREERMAWSHLALGVLVAAVLASVQWLPQIMARLQSFGVGKSGFLANNAGEISARMDGYALMLALGFLVLSLYCARQWVNARGLIVVGIFAALSFGASGYATTRSSVRTKNLSTWRSIDAINETLQNDYRDAPLYAPGLDDSLVLFYTGRRPTPFQDLASDTPSAFGSVVFLIQGDSLRSAAKAYKFSTALTTEISNDFSTLILPDNSPQLEEIRAAIKTFKSRKQAAAN